MSSFRSCEELVRRVVTALSRERVRQGISMNRLAEKTGLSLTTISYVERGLRSPTLETVARISLALEMDLGALLQRVSKAPKSPKA